VLTAYGLADLKFTVCEAVSRRAAPTHAAVLAHVVMGAGGAGEPDAVHEGVTELDGVPVPESVGVRVSDAEKDGVGETVAVAVLDAGIVAVPLCVSVPERDGVTVDVDVGVGLRDGETVGAAEREGVTVGVIESDAPADGVCVCEGVAVHVGATGSPGDVQPSGQGHASGAPTPAGQ